MSIKTIDINQPPPLEKLLAQVAAGDEIVFEENGRPIARLIPAEVPLPPLRRIPGLHAGQGGWVSDDFDAPLPDDFWNGRV